MNKLNPLRTEKTTVLGGFSDFLPVIGKGRKNLVNFTKIFFVKTLDIWTIFV